MDVVVLAAGMGARLGKQSNCLPKCLITVGEAPLLQRSLRQLAECGFRNVVVVVGHLAEQVQQTVDSSNTNLAITTVQNHEYANTGTAISLCCAAPHVHSESFLLLESDLLFTSDFLVEARRRSTKPTILVADSSGSGDEVFVVTGLDGRLKEIAKKLSLTTQMALSSDTAQLCGELAGISVLPRGFMDYLISRRATDQSFQRRDYESFIVDFSLMSPIEACWLEGAPWTEIDTLGDLDRARHVVWPLLEKEEAVRRRSDQTILSGK